MNVSTITGIIFYICVFIILPGYIAHRKGRRFWVWSLFSLLVPFFTLLIVILIDPPANKEVPVSLPAGFPAGSDPGLDDMARAMTEIMGSGEGDSPFMPTAPEEPVFRSLMEEQLASNTELYEAGLLTREEYEAKKARILAGDL